MSSSFSPNHPPRDNSVFDVELRQIFKIFNGEAAVSGVNLGIKTGEFFSILGPSGCGKTTLLRLIAGFETPSAGEVLIQERAMNEIPPYRRPVNTVFQSYALFNHLTVAENIAFGLKLRKLPPVEVRERVQEALVRVQMAAYANRFPRQLSGGQQQRVALARALVNKPAVVLLDEPLGALDLKLRKEMQVELSRLHQELGLTFVMVTHDQEEALSLSDRIAVMGHGKVEQVGPPQDIYDYPRTTFVADFIGDTNLLEGYIKQSDRQGLAVVTSKGLNLLIHHRETPSRDYRSNGEVVVSVRPEKIKLSLENPLLEGTGENIYAGKVHHVMYLGTHVQYLIQLATGDMLKVRQSQQVATVFSPQTKVFVHWSPLDTLALDG